MEKIKEKIDNETKKVGGTMEEVMFQSGFNTAIETTKIIINQELLDYTFIRVPKKVKLSEIKERLEDSIGWTLHIEKENNCIGLCSYMNDIEHAEVYIKDNKILWTDIAKNCQPNTKWVEEYKIAESYIEVDV